MTDALIKTLTKCLTDLLYQLESADDNQVDGDFAVNLMEVVGADLQTLEQGNIKPFIQAVEELASAETVNARKAYLENFGENFGLTDCS